MAVLGVEQQATLFQILLVKMFVLKLASASPLSAGGNSSAKEHKNANNSTNIYLFDLIRK
jgi:hypothetical protein